MGLFSVLFDQWEVAECAAVRAEWCVEAHLDAWCDGHGRAPGLDEIAQARQMRALAQLRLRTLTLCLAEGRRCTSVL